MPIAAAARLPHRSSCRALLTTLAVALGAAPAAGQGVCDGVAPIQHTALEAVLVADGLEQPLLVISPSGDLDRIFIVEQGGVIKIHQRGDAPGTNSVFLDISTLVDPPGAVAPANEQGLLGLAFDPDWDTNGTFYVNYTEITGNNNSCQFFGATCHTVVARYTTLDGTPNTNGDPASEVRLMRFQQPENNHNGGMLLFDDQGFLNIFTGDGGGAGDAHGTCGNGQDTTTLLGKMLRIDVNNVDPGAVAAECDLIGNYEIPSTNPFVGGTPSDCDEIWAYGLRNPWRSTFDDANGDLYIADVGQSTFEEVNFTHTNSTGGENYGWRVMEASAAFNETCDTASCTTFQCPVLEYGRSVGRSITGGYVYRGCLMPGLDGRYFYGDYATGFVKSFLIDRVAGAVQAGSELDHTAQLDPSGTDFDNGLTSFGVNARGELFINDRDDGLALTGSILKVLPVFTDMLVSGPGAGDMFLLGTSSWTWEDLELQTEHPVSTYRVYRGQPNSDFTCIHETTGTSWTGDTDVPAAGAQLAYLVTAVNPGGAESSPGDPEAARNLLPDPCPP